MRIYDEEKIKELNAEQWMIDLIKLNPSYVFWGCYEDYMCGEDQGWRSRSILNSFDEMWELDNLNECVNYYFEIIRENIECKKCNGIGYNEKTKQLYDDWYDFAETGGKWCYNITYIEIDALIKAGRLHSFFEENIYYDENEKSWMTWKNGKKIKCEKPIYPTALEVNSWSKKGTGHDAINRYICVEARAKHLGVFGYCKKCNGKGFIYIKEKAHLSLQLWILHPRKGCSKGVYIKNINKSDLPKIKLFLLKAKKRNNKRFNGVGKIV